MNKKFHYNVNLVPLSINNAEQNVFRDKLNAIPYLLYEVEELKNDCKIVINKPGGKRSFGRLSRNDFMVFIYNIKDETLWLISHNEITDDLLEKCVYNKLSTENIIRGLYDVCCGKEPNEVITNRCIIDLIGIPVETIFKAYKWIWGQEDCNYPNQKGRWLSMDNLLERFNITIEGR